MDKKYDIIIVGSGISGMSLAFYCAREKLNVLVLEKNDSLGGSFTTVESDNYWLEMGAHTMYNSYGNFIEIIEGCGLKEDLIRRKKVPYKVYNNGKISSVISQFNIPRLLVSIVLFIFQMVFCANYAKHYIYHSVNGMVFDSRVGIYISVL